LAAAQGVSLAYILGEMVNPNAGQALMKHMMPAFIVDFTVKLEEEEEMHKVRADYLGRVNLTANIVSILHDCQMPSLEGQEQPSQLFHFLIVRPGSSNTK
jgi:hypothetical protein